MFFIVFMKECFKCKITSDRAILIDAIIDEGIVKVCQKCSKNENIPLIRKPSLLRLEESEKKQTVYERMSKVAGIKPETINQNKEIKKQDKNLRELVEDNFKKSEKTSSPNDLVDNFHWVLMRKRRLKKISHKQLAEKINESVEAIKMAEKGILPNDYQGLIKKLENSLSVNLIKKEIKQIPKTQIEVVDAELLGKPEEVFEEDNSKILTISDLKNLKNKHEETILNNIEESPEFIKVKNANFLEKDLTPEEVDKVLNESVEASKKSFEIKNLIEKKENPVEKVEEIKDKKKNLSQKDIDDILFGRN